MQQFNQVLLAKQGWRLLHNQSSLVARVLKGRYYPRSSFLTAKVGYQPSYTWRSIIEAKHLLTEGCIWRVGDGQSIHIWQDNLLPHTEHKNIFTPPIENGTEQLVSTLIDQEWRIWKQDLIDEIFLPIDIPLITGIPLTRRHIPDALIWPHTKNGAYSVRSGYHWLRERQLIDKATPSTSSIKWHKLWKLCIPPKMKIFFWRLLHSALPYNMNLQRRGITLPANCSTCENSEDLFHVFIGCAWATVAWFTSPLGFKPPFSHTAALQHWLQTQLEAATEEALALIISVCWGIWAHRNNTIFNKKSISPQEAMATATQLIEEFRQLNINPLTVPRPITSVSWQPPQHDHIKLNTDAGCYSNNRWRSGAVFRNRNGSILLAISNDISGSLKPELAEAMTVIWALEIAINHGFKKLEVKQIASNSYRLFTNTAPSHRCKSSLKTSPLSLIFSNFSLLIL